MTKATKIGIASLVLAVPWLFTVVSIGPAGKVGIVLGAVAAVLGVLAAMQGNVRWIVVPLVIVATTVLLIVMGTEQ
jgi:hypothetical protein